MPSVSTKQHNFMALAAKNPSKIKSKKKPSQAIAKEFLAADKGKKFPKARPRYT